MLKVNCEAIMSQEMVLVPKQKYEHMMKLVNKAQDSFESSPKEETLLNGGNLPKDESVLKDKNAEPSDVAPTNLTQSPLYIERPLSRMISDRKTSMEKETTKTKIPVNKKKQKWINYTITY